MLRDKIRKIIDGGNVRISEIQNKISKIKETPMYSNEYKLELEAEHKQECIKIRNEIHDNIIKLFDEEIRKVNEENYYNDNDSSETANLLKMIELTKETMTEKEIMYLLEINKNNNIIKRVLAAIADSKGMYINNIKYLPNSIELQGWKEKLSGAILQSTDEGIESLKIELLLRNMNV